MKMPYPYADYSGIGNIFKTKKDVMKSTTSFYKSLLKFFLTVLVKPSLVSQLSYS